MPPISDDNDSLGGSSTTRRSSELSESTIDSSGNRSIARATSASSIVSISSTGGTRERIYTREHIVEYATLIDGENDFRSFGKLNDGHLSVGRVDLVGVGKVSSEKLNRIPLSGNDITTLLNDESEVKTALASALFGRGLECSGIDNVE